MVVLGLVSAVASAAEPVMVSVAARDHVDVVPAGEHGLVLYLRRAGSPRSYEIQGYDPAFSPTWSSSVELDRRPVQHGYDSDGDQAWLLLDGGRRSATVVRTDLGTGETRPLEVPLAHAGTTPGTLRADGAGGAWVSVNGQRSGNLVYVPASGAPRPVDIGAGVRVLDLVHADGSVQAAARPTRNRPDTPLDLLELRDGAISGRRSVRGSDAELLLTGQAVEANGRTLVVGTWERAGSLFGGADGMYVAAFDGDRQSTFVTHPFSGFEGLHEWLPEKRQARVEERTERKKAQGSEGPVRLNLLVTEAVALDHGIALAAEAYYPVYHRITTTRTTTNAQGVTTTSTTTTTVFLGWQFLYAIVAAFDPEGQRLWDHSVPLERRLTSVVAPHVRLLADGNELTLVYPWDRELYRVRVGGGPLEEPTAPIPAPADDEAGAKTLEGDATVWFGDTFLVWGTDRVRNEDDDVDRRFWFTRLDLAEPAPPSGAN
jgi:hypothetical protein